MDKEVLTIEHLEALRDLPWCGLHPVFDIELFRTNNPFFFNNNNNNNTIPIKTTNNNNDEPSKYSDESEILNSDYVNHRKPSVGITETK